MLKELSLPAEQEDIVKHLGLTGAEMLFVLARMLNGSDLSRACAELNMAVVEYTDFIWRDSGQDIQFVHGYNIKDTNVLYPMVGGTPYPPVEVDGLIDVRRVPALTVNVTGDIIVDNEIMTPSNFSGRPDGEATRYLNSIIGDRSVYNNLGEFYEHNPQVSGQNAD